MFRTTRRRGDGTIEVAICPKCGLRVEFIGTPMVRCYTSGETYEVDNIRWIPESEVPPETGYDVENIRGNDQNQDFMPNAHPPAADTDTA
jgi:endogenous inhibitor of DNA gyrase (YacG/DUF329 family)